MVEFSLYVIIFNLYKEEVNTILNLQGSKLIKK